MASIYSYSDPAQGWVEVGDALSDPWFTPVDQGEEMTWPGPLPSLTTEFDLTLSVVDMEALDRMIRDDEPPRYAVLVVGRVPVPFRTGPLGGRRRAAHARSRARGVALRRRQRKHGIPAAHLTRYTYSPSATIKVVTA